MREIRARTALRRARVAVTTRQRSPSPFLGCRAEHGVAEGAVWLGLPGEFTLLQTCGSPPERPSASSHVVHRPADSPCKHAAIAVRRVGNHRALPRLAARVRLLPAISVFSGGGPENPRAARPSSMARSYSHFELHVRRYMGTLGRPQPDDQRGRHQSSTELGTTSSTGRRWLRPQRRTSAMLYRR